jgi:Tfp pilus assembly protein PilN
MPLINLIESNIVAARKSEQQTRISRYTLIASAVVVGLAYISLLAQSSGLSAETQSVESQIKKMKPLITQIDEFKKSETEMTPRLATLSDAQDLTSRWGRVMGHLAVNTPPNVWLISMRAMMTDPKQPIHLTITGVGKTQADASEMLLRCQNAKDLESVNLVGTTERVLEKSSAVEFEIGGDIVGTAPPAPKDEDTKVGS